MNSGKNIKFIVPTNDSYLYFRASKFSKSYYIYLSSICRGAIDGADETLKCVKESLQKAITASSQKEGIIEKFLMNRCSFVIPDGECDEIFWKLLCYEIMYLWNLLASCSTETLESIIDDCNTVNKETEPIFGLTQFILGSSYANLKNYRQAIISYKQCIEMCNKNPSNKFLSYVPAYACYELAVLLGKQPDDEYKEEVTRLLLNIQTFKNYDFEHRLKLKLHNIKMVC